ncbi:P-loop containing nucleoside triphosphate hydrolase protein [Gonapodya prolifera JEL478]|uniref:p-loop containing nucleoside triphosphate hydrolase protein n=1 Tax=Gonapodya prolifera (strain JEL478) TaxID=1344416 RepID=A0A139AU68_GONPJ|nr:P-loop containing nucleoside triphosphate hydrolase protein [Gonapodya prolifera JEL478]|eukprot:KXS20280.1 P-loop containing nucleoside triphosphate hydrolase protein [Gonapodya prolifera JEL478]
MESSQAIAVSAGPSSENVKSAGKIVAANGNSNTAPETREPLLSNAEESAPGLLGAKRMVRMGSWAVKDESELRPSYFSFRNISCVLPVKGVDKQLLLNASGYVKPGEALAIMGPSGAGKSTLLDILSYRKTTGRYTQDIMLNGERLTQLTSDDLLPPELTVREALEFCAALRLPPDWTHEQKEARIEDVLSVMRLNYVQNNRIGSSLVRGLSTGERKRVNVAVELLPVAAVVFLDEPTTGLDSNTGREIVENCLEVVRMRKLACVATIHQPSYTILRQFDSILLLANGRMCYFGKVADCIGYFENYLGIPVHGNPAEIYAEAQAANPDRLIEAWDKASEKAILDKAIDAIHSGQGSIAHYKPIGTDELPTFWDDLGFYQQASGWVQFRELFKRQMIVYLRNSIMSTSRLFAAIATAMFFGFAYLKLERNIAGGFAKAAELFALKLMTPGFGSAAIAYWLEKRKAYYHEEAAGYYHKLFYLITNFIVEWLFLSVMMAICVVIAMSLSGWIVKFFGFHILYFILEAWSVAGWNLVCAYMSASIPYANAAFNLHYFWGILLAGFYLTDSFMYTRPGGNIFKYFLIWTSYDRPFENQTSRCDPGEQYDFDLTSITMGGMGDASLDLTRQAIKNQTIISLIDSLGSSAYGKGWIGTSASTNATIKPLYDLAYNVYVAVTANATLASIASPPAVLRDFVNTRISSSVSALASYAGIDGSNPGTLNDTVTKLLTASNMIAYSQSIKLPGAGLPPVPLCLANTGDDFLANFQLVMTETQTLANGSTVTVKGFDDPSITPNWVYQLDNLAQGLFMFTIAFLCLRFCNFRQK